MCGLFGFASTEKMKNISLRRQTFIEGLETASWRGRQSTGIAMVRLGAETAPAEVFKQAVSAHNFVQTMEFDRYLSDLDEFSYCIGHARAATQRVNNIIPANAHPFQHGPVTLVHNGTVTNFLALDSGLPQGRIDSDYVAAAIGKNPTAPEVLGELLGGYALVWHDARDGSLNFARNNEKPLYWCYIAEENTMFWHSEMYTLFTVLSRAGYKIDGKFKELNPYRMVKFDNPKDLREFAYFPFARPTVRDTQGRWASSGTISPPQSPVSGNTEKAGTPNGTATATPTSEISTETWMKESDYPYIDVRGLKTAIPSAKRKQYRAAMRLRAIGFKMKQYVIFRPSTFSGYKGKDSRFGVVRGFRETDKERVVFEMPNMSIEKWVEATKMGRLYGSVANIRAHKDGGKFVVVLDFKETLHNRMYLSHQKGNHSETPVAKVSGPGGREVFVEEFLALCQYGCSSCSGNIDVADAHDVAWVGELGNQPLCTTCQHNDSVMQTVMGVGNARNVH